MTPGHPPVYSVRHLEHLLIERYEREPWVKAGDMRAIARFLAWVKAQTSPADEPA